MLSKYYYLCSTNEKTERATFLISHGRYLQCLDLLTLWGAHEKYFNFEILNALFEMKEPQRAEIPGPVKALETVSGEIIYSRGVCGGGGSGC